MIRVLYRWRVDRGRADEFVQWWSAGTRTIRETFPGAMGSVLMRVREGDGDFAALARWSTEDDWHAFMNSRRDDDQPDGWELCSIEPFDEAEDLTIDKPNT